MCFGAGVAAFMLGQDEVAQARFECALSRNPASVPAATWLADLHYRAGRLADAIAVYEALGRHSSKAAELQQQIDLLRKEDALQRRFTIVRNDHFIAYFESAGDAPLAREVIDRLEAAYSRIGKALGTHPAQPITVVLYTREQFDDITQLSAWSVAGVRRVEAVTGDNALTYLQQLESTVSRLAGTLKVTPAEVQGRVGAVMEQVRTLEKELAALKGKLASAQGDELLAQAVDVKGLKVLAATLNGADAKTLRETMDKLKDKLKSAAIVLAAVDGTKVQLAAGVTADSTARVKAGELVNFVAQQVGGKGGGKPDLAMAGGTDATKLPQALASVQGWIAERL